MKLYRAKTLIPEFGDCRDVTISWFKAEPTGAARPCRELIEGYDEAAWGAVYDRGCIDELFTEDEAEQLVAYLDAAHEGVGSTMIEEACLPIAGMGLGAIPIGGGVGHYALYAEPGYTLAFKAIGYFDRRGCALIDGGGVFKGRVLKVGTDAGDISWQTDIEVIQEPPRAL